MLNLWPFTRKRKPADMPADSGYQPVPPSLVQEYERIRPQKHAATFCQAPFNNMYFSWEGKIIACCYNQKYELGNYPEQTIREIWKGEKANALREHLRHNDLSRGCDVCYRDLVNGRMESVNAQRFDWFPVQEYPSMMEFQLTNTCNLECVMCDGHLSSAIRANREKLPAIPNKYDAAFVQQLEEFIPHLQYTTFSGGEPFLIKIYFDIWEQFARLNPGCTIKVITNGTILTDRVKSILERCRFHITISLDSPVKETYESIRKGASFDTVMQNAAWFRDYCRSKGTEFNFNFCPMTDNWREIPAFIALCNAMDVVCHFNTVYSPMRHSLMYRCHPELEAITAFLLASVSPPQSPVEKKNNLTLQEFTRMLNVWAERNKKILPAGKLTADDVLQRVEEKITTFDQQGMLTDVAEIRRRVNEIITAENLEGMMALPFYQSLQDITPEALQQVVYVPIEETVTMMRRQTEMHYGS